MPAVIDIWYAFLEACARFWTNRFHSFNVNDEIEWLKLQLEKERAEKVKLLNHILEPSETEMSSSESEMNFKPVGNKGFVPWHVKQRNLEEQSRAKARELGHEAKTAIEELEEELGIG